MPVFAANSAVFLLYHRFGENQYPATNIRVSQFVAQLNWLKRNGYHVLPVPEIVSRLQRHRSLPDKTIGIIIDDAYDSAYHVAWPLLRKYHFPFAVFVATDPVDKGYRDMMTWDQLRQMAKAGVTIGDHSASHGHLANAPVWLIRRDVERSQGRLYQELGFKPRLFAYPYGEYSVRFQKVIQNLGFAAAFMQVSGVASQHSDFYALARFALNEAYGGMDRFRVLSAALPLDIKGLSPKEPILKQNPPTVHFTVVDHDIALTKLACFPSGQGRAWLQIKGRKVSVRPRHAFGKGRARINCTVPTAGGQFRWLGLFYLVA